MDMIDQDSLLMLLRTGKKDCVSISMPAHKESWRDMQQDAIRYKNLLKKAEGMLIERGMRKQEATNFLEGAHRVLKYDFFREHPSNGLALFISHGVFTYYWVPVHLEEMVVVNDRFEIKPLLEVFAADSRFFLLCVSMNDMKLFQGSKYALTKFALKNVPFRMEDAMKHLEYSNDAVQFRGTTNALKKGRGGLEVMQGHGIGVDNRKDEIANFFRIVDRGIHPLINGTYSPLVLAGVDYVLSLYRSINSYPLLVGESVIGNPDGLTRSELHEKSWKIMQPRLEKAQEDALSVYRQLAGEMSSYASNNLPHILESADRGRVSVLFLARDTDIWGTVDGAGKVSVHEQEEAGDEDLLDRAAATVLAKGGTIYLRPRDAMPDQSSMAAIYRY